MTDTQLIDWLESRFTGAWRESIFIANEIGGDMLVMDAKSNIPEVYRAKTVRELLHLAMQNEQDQKTSAQA